MAKELSCQLTLSQQELQVWDTVHFFYMNLKAWAEPQAQWLCMEVQDSKKRISAVLRELIQKTWDWRS